LRTGASTRPFQTGLAPGGNMTRRPVFLVAEARGASIPIVILAILVSLRKS
jgi:hypothetical protein